jgi:activator of HSP90 ATPase
MTKPILQSAKFPVSPKQLFETFLDSKKHSTATGAPARVSRKVGGKFTAWHNQLWGHNLMIVPGRLIVQAWRSTNFNKSDPDSILVLEFTKDGKGGRVHMVHANVPEQDHKGVTKGWPKYYWKPWREYFAKRNRA